MSASAPTYRAARMLAVAGVLALAYDRVLRPRLMGWGAGSDEIEATYPGDNIIPGGRRGSVMATTIDAPPERVWPWLVQMGAQRAGFYSWDHLDNAGRPSATHLHPEWQDVEQGGRIVSLPDGGAWFDVALLDAPRTLVLRATFRLPVPRNISPEEPLPRAFSDSTWAFHLLPTAPGRTRLIVTSSSRGRPAMLISLANRFFWDPAHWVMQVRQFQELRRRVEAADSPASQPRDGRQEVAA